MHRNAAAAACRFLQRTQEACKMGEGELYTFDVPFVSGHSSLPRSLSVSNSKQTNNVCWGTKCSLISHTACLPALLERWLRVVVSELASEIWWGADPRPIAWNARGGRAASVPCRLQFALPRSAADRGSQRPPCPCPAAQGPSERGRPLLPSLILPALRSDGVFGKRLEKI